MLSHKVILFDLDGTLSNPLEGIQNSVEYAMEKMNVTVTDLDVATFIGPPMKETLEKYFHLNPSEIEHAIFYYRQYFRKKGMFQNELYPNITRLLQNLKDRGHHLVVATSKPYQFAEKIVQYFEIDHLFDFIAGSNIDGTRTDKGEIIQYAMEQFPEYETSDFVMIGDREQDIIGAAKQQITSIGVTYGFGTAWELNNAKADYIVNCVEELEDLFK